MNMDTECQGHPLLSLPAAQLSYIFLQEKLGVSLSVFRGDRKGTGLLTYK